MDAEKMQTTEGTETTEKGPPAQGDWVLESTLAGRFGLSRNDLRAIRGELLHAEEFRHEGGRVEISAAGVARIETELTRMVVVVAAGAKALKKRVGVAEREKMASAEPGAGGAQGAAVKNGFMDPAGLIALEAQPSLVKLRCVRGYTIRNPKLIEACREGSLEVVLVRVRDNGNFAPGMWLWARPTGGRMHDFVRGDARMPVPVGRLPRVRGRW